jgi:TolA-binding protein
MRGERGALQSGLGWAGLSLLVLAGCAPMYEATGTASQHEVSQLRSELNSLKVASQRTRADVEAAASRLVEQRLRQQSAETTKQLAALTARIDTLSTELTALSSRTRDLAQRFDTVSRTAAARPAPAAPQQSSTPSPAAPRTVPAPAPSAAPGGPVAPVPPAVAAAPAPAVAPPPSAPPAPAPVSPAPAPAPHRPTTGALQPEDVYQAAYIDFSKGNYALAIPGFREFLRRYPEHKLADSAQYWIGESHLGQAHGLANEGGQADKVKQELEQAVREFRKVIANHPRGDKVPTALYKEALVLVELDQVGVAQQRLQYLIDNFPRAEEAPLARDRLAALKER